MFYARGADEVLPIKNIHVMGTLLGNAILVISKKRKFFHFTLVELLIVVAILAILTAMLLPALNNARSTAKASACTNNLKQTFIMMSMYSVDYKAIPIQFWSWHLQKAGYIGEPNWPSIRCPVWAPQNKSINYRQVYGMRQTEETVKSFLHCNNPSEDILLADSIRLSPSDVATGLKQYFCFYGTAGQYMNRVHCRHKRKANVGFMDGHVQPCSGKELVEMQCPKYCFCPGPYPEHLPLY